MTIVNNGISAETAVRKWREFAYKLQVTAPNGSSVSWTKYLERYAQGRADERTIVGPVAFPAFAEQVLGYEVGRTLAPERSGAEGRPDFTPADAVTHPFVFEVKGTDGGVALSNHEEQVTRYLIQGRERIRRVILTNLYGLRVFELDEHSRHAIEILAIDLRTLALMPVEYAIKDPRGHRLAQFLNDYRFTELSLQQKIQRVREAPPWNPGLEVTDPTWVLRRLDSVVEAIRSDVQIKVNSGYLLDPTVLQPADRPLVERELRELDIRVGSTDKDTRTRTIQDYISAAASSRPGLALQQFIAHTAFYTATRLLLVRAWEDSELLSVALYNGGFDHLMSVLESVSEVVATAYGRAGNRYPDLFARHNALSWYTPSEDVYINAVYDLANTYLGDLSDDILGEVYERQLARVDRKQLGQYYTPRDIIKVIWDLIDINRMADAAEDEERPIRILDIATGSGGFLVAASSRLRDRYLRVREAGATVDAKAWLADVTDGLIGCEIQQFSAYLAEVNLVLQLSSILRSEKKLRLPALRIHCADTLTLHNPDDTALIGAMETVKVDDHSGVQTATEIAERQESLDRLRDPYLSGDWLDVAVGNPPYVGEKSIAATLADLRARHPYWQQFSAIRQDYLYYFLILGVSKLRRGGRFGFITTEYWLTRIGAAPLRRYLAEHTRIERLILFRNLTLFPDAPGQHNLIVIGERVTDPSHPEAPKPKVSSKPQVSIYVGPAHPNTREPSLDAIRDGRNAPSSALVQTFESRRDPNKLGAGSWAEVVMSNTQLTRRAAVQRYPSKAGLVMAEGVIATPQRLPAAKASLLSQITLDQIGGPNSRTGIFELTETEFNTLNQLGGGLTQDEIRHIRPIFNTRDVYPYATILPAHPNRLIWLPDSHGGVNDEFPPNMPTLEVHLRRFKPLLESVVEGYGATRPWWSAHRPRTEVVENRSATAGWADLAAMTRWGDRKLVTGLAPAHSLPLSGLHAFTGSGGTTTAYLVGLINSTPVQELAEALAPGSVGQKDIEELGLPQFDSASALAIHERVVMLADIVKTLVTKHGTVWPDIPDALRGDITLNDGVFNAWTPVPGRRNWGTLATVPWARIAGGGVTSGRVEYSELSDDLLGRHLAVYFARGQVLIDADEHTGIDLRDLLQTLVRGMGSVTAPQLMAMPLPVSGDILVEIWKDNLGEVTALIQDYQRLRSEVDAIVVTALSAV